MPLEYWCGFSYVAMSITVAGSKIAVDASEQARRALKRPGANSFAAVVNGLAFLGSFAMWWVYFAGDDERGGEALAEAPLAEAQTIAFGDLFLDDIRAYREERLSRVGKEAIFPLWGRDTSALAREFVASGFEAILVCVDPRQLDPSFAGRRFDAEGL